MKVISLLSMKGGTAKTTTAVNLAAGLANKGYKTLLIDADAQGNASSYFCKEKDYLTTLEQNVDKPYRLAMETTLTTNKEYPYDTYDVLMNPEKVVDAFYPTGIDSLAIMPSQNHQLILADKNITLDTRSPQQTRIKKALKLIRSKFDYVIIDNAPTSNSVTINSLIASNLIIIPTKPGGDEIEGLASTVEDIETIKDNFDCNVDFKILLTMFHKKTNAGFNRKLEMQEYRILNHLFEDKLFKSIIRYQDGVTTRTSINKEIIINTKTKIADDYTALIQEIIQGGAENE